IEPRHLARPRPGWRDASNGQVQEASIHPDGLEANQDVVPLDTTDPDSDAEVDARFDPVPQQAAGLLL
ncbi:MAG TPA: hypothetical protein QGF05_00945, partial [Dehalococcoidia bacterium]|nr:hypothetical protein [Dehalococcoidia bacterium]